MLAEPQATSADLLFDLAGIRVRVSAWFWLAGAGHAAADDRGRQHERAQHAVDLLAPGAREEQHERRGGGSRPRDGRVEFVEEGMAHERAPETVGHEPFVLEGQRREDAAGKIDEAVDVEDHPQEPHHRPPAVAGRSLFMRVFVSAGEPSGDHHAALLVRALRERRPDLQVAGLGGPHMAAEGETLRPADQGE